MSGVQSRFERRWIFIPYTYIYRCSSHFPVHSSSRVDISPAAGVIRMRTQQENLILEQNLSVESDSHKSRLRTANQMYNSNAISRRCKGGAINVIYYWSPLDSSSCRTKPKKINPIANDHEKYISIFSRNRLNRQYLHLLAIWLLKHVFIIDVEIRRFWKCFWRWFNDIFFNVYYPIKL